MKLGLIGAGGFTGQVLLPAIAKTPAQLVTIVSSKGVSGTHLGKKFGFLNSSTDAEATIKDDNLNSLVITTRHNSHARFVLLGLREGKKVFVEKPLCLTTDELEEIVETHRELEEKGRKPFVMVGFNRRFAPQIVRMKSLLTSVSTPMVLQMTVNAGSIPASHWTQDREIGGGRIIGEGCHFIDLLRYLVGSKITHVESTFCSGPQIDESQDVVVIVLTFEDGSIGTINYLANGHKSYPKETLKVFCGGKVLDLDNFRNLTGFGWKGFKKMNLWNQDKGHHAEMEAFVNALEKGHSSPIPFDEIVEVTKASYTAAGVAG